MPIQLLGMLPLNSLVANARFWSAPNVLHSSGKLPVSRHTSNIGRTHKTHVNLSSNSLVAALHCDATRLLQL